MRQVHRDKILEIFQASLDAVNGRRCVREWVQHNPVGGDVRVVAIGKAAGAMFLGAREALGGRLCEGLIVTKYAHAEPQLATLTGVRCLEAGHPVPDANSLAAGAALLDFLQQAPPDARLLFLVSGGASALVDVLPPGVELSDLERVNRWLLGAGLDIHAMNRVRKSLSVIKGGRLSRHLGGRHADVLMISDVMGDDPAVIGSGLLAPDYSPAGLPSLPPWLESLVALAPASPSPSDPCFGSVRLHVIATLRQAMEAAAARARSLGYDCRVHPDLFACDAANTGRRVADVLLSGPRQLHVWGGESTVMLPETPGRGGRNQHLALAAAVRLAGHELVYLLAAGTDGTDGPGEDAGALVDGQTVARGELEGLSAAESLAAADAGTFLEASGDLVQTGPTGTNVMDLVLGLKVSDE